MHSIIIVSWESILCNTKISVILMEKLGIVKQQVKMDESRHEPN